MLLFPFNPNKLRHNLLSSLCFQGKFIVHFPRISKVLNEYISQKTVKFNRNFQKFNIVSKMSHPTQTNYVTTCYQACVFRINQQLYKSKQNSSQLLFIQVGVKLTVCIITKVHTYLLYTTLLIDAIKLPYIVIHTTQCIIQTSS